MGDWFDRLLPDPIRRRYVARLAVVFLLVAVVVGGVGAYAYVHAGEVVERDARAELRSSAEIKAANLDEWFTRMEVQMHAVAASSAFQGDRSEATVFLFDVVQRDDDIAAAYYIDTANDTVLTSVGDAQVASAETVTRAYGRKGFTSIEAETTGEVVVSEPFRVSADGAPIILFAASIPSRPDRAVVAVTDLSALSASKLHHHDVAGQFVVTDGSGQVVMTENESRILQPDPLGTRPFTDESGVFSTAPASTSTEVGYATLDTHDWVVTARVPTQQAYALRDEILTQFLVVIGAVLGGAVLLGATVGRDTVRQVHTLAGKARALRDGRLDVTVETDRADEFGDLFEAFEVMRRSLQRRLAEVEQAREAANDARLDALAAKQESEAFSQHLEETAAAYGAVMAACANGDLTERIDHETESPAMRDVARSFNAMMDDVQAQNEQLETVSHVLSHDLRNPLNVALGRAELLESDVDSPHTEPLVDSLDRIDTIIDDALLLALNNRVEETRPVTLWDAVQRAWGHVETGDARLELDGDVGFEADTALLGHVFENLFRNSVEHAADPDQSARGDVDGDDATSDGRRVGSGGDVDDPSVTIRVGPLDADGSGGGANAGIAGGFYVEDDGPGIPPAERDRVFETGFTTNRTGGGTGFGLAIVSKVVDVHGWKIHVTESDSSGARFEISELTNTRINESMSESLA
jgi:methyl-accepting chemotaxis protein